MPKKKVVHLDKSGSRTYRNAAEGFELRVPSEGWRVDESDPALLVTFSQEEMDAYVMVIASVVPPPENTRYPNEMLDHEFRVRTKASLDVIRNQFDRYFIHIDRMRRVNGLNCREVWFTASKGPASFRGKVVHLLHGRKIFILNGSTTEENYERVEPDLDAILYSFTPGP